MKLGRLMSLRAGMEHGAGEPRHYIVEDMPPGQRAEIQDRAPRHKEPRWSYRRTLDGVTGEWTGECTTADGALEKLKAAVRAELDQTVASRDMA